jgi:hypothetical protein
MDHARHRGFEIGPAQNTTSATDDATIGCAKIEVFQSKVVVKGASCERLTGECGAFVEYLDIRSDIPLAT